MTTCKPASLAAEAFGGIRQRLFRPICDKTCIMIWTMFTFWLAAFVSLPCGSGSANSSFHLELLRPPSELYQEIVGGFWAINISGEIPADAAKRFVKFMEESGLPSRIHVYLDSPGGSVVGGMALGRELRARLMDTFVGRRVQGLREETPYIDFLPGICYSACSLAFLGGHFRWIDEKSKFGVHRFYFQNPSPDNADLAQILSASMTSYVHEMGVDVSFMELSARKAGIDLEIVSRALLKKLNVINDGSTLEQWSVKGIGGALYVRGERDTIFGNQKIILIHDSGQFYLWAIFETRNRDELLKTMDQVDIEIDMKFTDASSRKYVTEINNGYFNIFIPISEEEARTIAAAQSVGVIMRGGPDAGVFLGISGMDVERGRELLTGFINSHSK